jgi:hypothetical protein
MSLEATGRVSPVGLSEEEYKNVVAYTRDERMNHLIFQIRDMHEVPSFVERCDLVARQLIQEGSIFTTLQISPDKRVPLELYLGAVLYYNQRTRSSPVAQDPLPYFQEVERIRNLGYQE